MATKPELKPVRWNAPARTTRARERTGSEAVTVRRRIPLSGSGPEDVVVGQDGALYTGVQDGRILAVDLESLAVQQVAKVEGRPLGLHALPDGRLLICDAYHGLLRLDPLTGHLETLLTEVDGDPLRCCSNVVATRDGTIFVSHSSRRFDLAHYKGDLMEHSGTGRLVRLAPGEKPEVLLDGLQFANGVALSADESFVAVAETGAYQVRRVHLTGSAAGSSDILADNLPGFPDNMSTGPGGIIWVAIAAPRDPLLDLLQRTPPILRRAVWRLPDRLQPDGKPTAWVLGLDETGRTVHDLQRGDVGFGMVTGVCETDGRLYLGSLTEGALLDIESPA